MSDPSTGLAAPAPAEQPTLTAGTAPPGAGVPTAAQGQKPRGLLGDAWYDLRRKPLFWASALLILFFLTMAAFPSLFTSADPDYGTLERANRSPSAEGWFGFDRLGRDIYARTIYGARASILVAGFATVGTVLVGGLFGVLAGYRGSWGDALISRIGEMFSAVPFVLGGIVILFTFNAPGSNRGQYEIMALVTTSLVVLTWPVAMRIMRSSVLATRDADYIQAARALGAGPGRIVFKHIIPNCLAPLLVYATILIGAYIGAEATLSFLGIGLKSPVVSWGIMINEAQGVLRVWPYQLLFPAAFLVAAVLSFVMLGEAVREALDPKLR